MQKIYPDNPTLYCQRIRASYQKYIEYHQQYPKYVPRNKALSKKLLTEAKKVVDLSDTKIISTYFGNERENAILRAIRVLNKATEIMFDT